MARVEAKTTVRKKMQAESLPFGKMNYQLLGAGVFVIALGYVALSQKPWDGVLPLVVAPILLVIGYCVIIPVSILYRKKNPADQGAAQHQEH
jgi:hypothetical protein